LKTLIKKDLTEELKKELKSFKEKLPDHISGLQNDKMNKVILFLSVGRRDKRALVFIGSGNLFDSSWKNLSDKAIKYIKKRKEKTDWLKVDIVSDIEEISVTDFIIKITETKTNYFRYGISFDRDFNFAFLEQEVNANEFIKFSTENKRAYMSEQNINDYCLKYRNQKYPINFNNINSISLFKTISFFYENNECYELENSLLNNGRRKTPRLTKETTYDILHKSSLFLANMVQENGKYIYGYFPCFDKKINFYNILRHASSTYSMIEAYEITRDEAMIIPIEKALDYLEKEAIVKFEENSNDSFAYIIDKESGSEIKLGANAAAILAFSKYTMVFHDKRYLPLMRQIARGIEQMQDPNTGQFVHVLNYPDLSIKEAFRIIYYDGEAAFALMRLYEIDPDPRWIAVVEKAFSYFIKNKYWKHADHWLSYCTNELTTYRPLDEYFQFGLENAKHRLAFMMKRETTYPTFLELTTAAYKMIKRIKELNKHYLLGSFNEEELLAVIHHRAQYQLNGFFYPEMAMYFQNPEKILSGFFIRHHSFRCRIDDVEHNISGYCSYLTELLVDE
jgi:hypothetical protein